MAENGSMLNKDFYNLSLIWLLVLFSSQALATSEEIASIANSANHYPDVNLHEQTPLPAHEDSLWMKAVDLCARDRHWEPGLIRSFTRYVDKTEYPKSFESFWRRHSPGENGEVKKEIIKALKNGKDITEKKQKKYSKPAKPTDGISETALGLDGTLPFDTEIQAQISYRRIDLENSPRCENAVAFSFTRQMEHTAHLSGIVWLDANTGRPLKLLYAPDPLPGRIKKMTIEMLFDSTPEGAWKPSEVNITAMGKFLFFTKRLRNTTSITDYWNRKNPAEQKSLTCR